MVYAMYRVYIFEGLYTLIEKGRRRVMTRAHLSVRKSGSNPKIARWKQTVSPGETSSFPGGN